MNRLIIVGNGFDLAHGLPTSYNNFINDFWSNFRFNYRKDYIRNIVDVKDDYSGVLNYGDRVISCYNDFQSNVSAYASDRGLSYHNSSGEGIFQLHSNRYIAVVYNNILFKIICEKQSVQSWVDVENEYYKLLKGCLDENDNERVKKLNSEFEVIKNLLVVYLQNQVCDKIEFESGTGFEEIIKYLLVRPIMEDVSEEIAYFKEFPKKHREKLIEYNKVMLEKHGKHLLQDYIDTGLEQNLFLNFNYTPSVDKYISAIRNSGRQNIFGNTSQIQIHGRLGDEENQINFGFGDEMDKRYQEIEEKDDNEYLQNIKSFKYFQNSNYKDMLDFIDTDEFQVFIMGHSCGLSDRILLNKIFEHEYCLSIKVFYYENAGKDNYTEVVQNISRHFNKKEMMREKIVNKSLCEALPQTIRFDTK
jgi:hypothetical protein